MEGSTGCLSVEYVNYIPWICETSHLGEFELWAKDYKPSCLPTLFIETEMRYLNCTQLLHSQTNTRISQLSALWRNNCSGGSAYDFSYERSVKLASKLVNLKLELSHRCKNNYLITHWFKYKLLLGSLKFSLAESFYIHEKGSSKQALWIISSN